MATLADIQSRFAGSSDNDFRYEWDWVGGETREGYYDSYCDWESVCTADS